MPLIRSHLLLMPAARDRPSFPQDTIRSGQTNTTGATNKKLTHPTLEEDLISQITPPAMPLKFKSCKKEKRCNAMTLMIET